MVIQDHPAKPEIRFFTSNSSIFFLVFDLKPSNSNYRMAAWLINKLMLTAGWLWDTNLGLGDVTQSAHPTPPGLSHPYSLLCYIKGTILAALAVKVGIAVFVILTDADPLKIQSKQQAESTALSGQKTNKVNTQRQF